MEIDSNTLNSFFSALTVLILALIAWWNKQRTDSAAITATATTQTASSNQAIALVTPGIAPATTIPSNTLIHSSSDPQTFNPGFSVQPAEVVIKSGTPLTLRIQTGLATKHLTIDWKDGTPIQDVPLLAGSASPIHTFTFSPSEHYTRCSFFPKFTISDDRGHYQEFNNDPGYQGDSCAIYVEP